MDDMSHDFEGRKKNTWVRRQMREGPSGRKKDYEIETRVSDSGRRERRRKPVTNCKCCLAALTDRPIILLAHLEAMPG